jgi:hypothetical protein
MENEGTHKKRHGVAWLLGIAGCAIAAVAYWPADRPDVAPSESRVAAGPAEEATTPASIEAEPEPMPPLTEAEALRGTIKTVSCMPEGAGTSTLSRAEMFPPHEAVQAMEGCLDMTSARHPEHRAIQMSVVFYLVPDGSVSQTGVGADVDTAEAWELLQPCASSYWQAFAPTVKPTDEKSFTCVYHWSENSIGGGIASVRAPIAHVWSGRDTAQFGASRNAAD